MCASERNWGTTDCARCDRTNVPASKTTAHPNECNDCYRARMREYMRSYSRTGMCNSCGEPCTRGAKQCRLCHTRKLPSDLRCARCGEEMANWSERGLCGFCLAEGVTVSAAASA
jgi:hypothetical protein